MPSLEKERMMQGGRAVPRPTPRQEIKGSQQRGDAASS